MPNKKIAPSRQLTKAVDTLLHDASNREGGSLLRELARMGAQRLIQEALEQEQKEVLGRDRYERGASTASRKLYRNGYESGRLLLAEGPVVVQRPQIRGGEEPYRSSVWERFKNGMSPELERIAVEMYARGLSTRDIEDVFRGPDGEALLSRSAVSQLTDALWEEYEAFSQRDLSEIPLVYLIVDGVYEAMRRVGNTRDGLLVAWGILENGQRALLHVEVGSRESRDSCLAFLRGMVARGLRAPLLSVSDGAPGMISALQEVFPDSLRQRCLFHKKQNILAKVPMDQQTEILTFLSAIYNAPTMEVAQSLAKEFVSKYERIYPTAISCFLDDLDACLVHLKCPEAHRKAIRTTNVIERAFEELRRRTKVIPRFFDERSCLKLAFAELVRAGQRARRVRMSDIELRQIAILRKDLRALCGESSFSHQ